MTHTVVEKEALLASMENDAEFLKTVIGIFLADCPEMLARIQGGAAKRDALEIMNASHALRGSVSLFGAREAVEAARILESMGKDQKLEGLTEAVGVLEREIALVSDALKDIAKQTA